MTAKPTPAQLAVLQDLAGRGWITDVYRRYRIQTVGALERRRLIEWRRSPADPNVYEWRITAAGRDALEVAP